MNAQTFINRVAIVTGAGKGIGQACAIAFTKLGAAVILNSRSEAPLSETLAVIEQSGGKAVIAVGDVSEEKVARDTVAQAVREFGRLDFAINNAGISPTAAAALNVSVNTVKFHMRQIYEKMQVHSKSEAVAKALRDRLIK